MKLRPSPPLAFMAEGEPNGRSAPTVVHASNRDPRWLEFISQTHPTLFQHPDWATLIEEAYGFGARVAMVVEDGVVIGGLPYCEVDDFRGKRFVAEAFADVCEPLGDERVWPIIEEALCAAGVPWQIRSRVKPGELAAETREVGVHQVVDLPASVEQALSQASRRKRKKIETAERDGVRARELDETTGIDTFYRMHTITRKEKHRLLPQPRQFFEALRKRFFPDRGSVIAAERDGTILAVILTIVCGDTLFAKFSASDPSGLVHRPNDFLFWKCIERGVSLGLRRFDLGISESETLMRFKSEYGTLDKPVYVGRYNPVESSATTKAVESALHAATAALTQPDVPMSATQAGGDALYRFFV